MKIGIIGMGACGQAQQRWLAKSVHVTYDPKFDDEYLFGKFAECNFIVVCVPAGSVAEVMTGLPAGRPVLLRSTVPPGTTERFGHRVVYCPEFIQDTPGSTWRDPDDVPFLILGGEGTMTAKFRRWIKPRFQGGIFRCSTRVAELVKYTDSAHLAAKVTLANEMSRVACAFGVDWRDVEQLWRIDPRTGYTHTSLDVEPGFSGAFARDLAAIIAVAAQGEYNAEFLQAIEEANARFRQ